MGSWRNIDIPSQILSFPVMQIGVGVGFGGYWVGIGAMGCSWMAGKFGEMAVVWVMVGGSFFHRESLDKLRMSGDGEVRGELHGRMGSLRDLGMYSWWQWVMRDVKGEVSGNWGLRWGARLGRRGKEGAGG